MTGKSQNPARTRDTADLAALVEEIIGYWKELGRRRFYVQPGADPDKFYRLWPRIFENFFLAETASIVSRPKRPTII